MVSINRLFQNYSIYIGRNADFKQNAICAGSPFQQVDDPDSYVLSHRAKKDNLNFYNQGEGLVWPFGAEHWCNLEGEYVHIVANLRHLVGDYEMNVCSLGVIGTRYVRDGEALASEIVVLRGESLSLSVPHIYSEIKIGARIAIDVRAKPESNLIKIVNHASWTDVQIETAGQAAGAYEIALESFNTLSSV